MKSEISCTYKSDNYPYSLYVTIPKRRDINSYSEELWAQWGTFTLLSENSPEKFDESEFKINLNLRIYFSEKMNSRVLVTSTLKPNDFSAIPESQMIKFGPLKSITSHAATNDINVIQEILANGYRIE
ncbi:hypothetical protein [Dyadobacter sp. LHD-138]|uniref:hypothetical protein n=1 Tax=Dyadobacter sp. LHD-138 TaxID=3071413 RepID=UPI0027DF1BD1|nr:hypothetical protein [Dyadobacter sp. LHD-138]MDQ6481599.1 hypothetical protein [Dyadobacter sp. LHD-138]